MQTEQIFQRVMRYKRIKLITRCWRYTICQATMFTVSHCSKCLCQNDLPNKVLTGFITIRAVFPRRKLALLSFSYRHSQRHYVKIQEELAKLPVPAGLEDVSEPFQLPAAPSPPPAPAPPPPAADDIDHDMEKIVSQVTILFLQVFHFILFNPCPSVGTYKDLMIVGRIIS